METSDAGSIILDSSVWVAFLRDSDSQRGKAKRILGNLQDAAVAVPEYVLVEVATALKNKGYEKVAKKFVAEVMEDGRAFLPAGESLAHATAKLFLERERDYLSFTDTALLALSEQYRVITFDRKLQKAIDKARG
ncbi:MAG: type II toxin-antitoxin system VapC family toxin [Patescibacteria group bacterium]